MGAVEQPSDDKSGWRPVVWHVSVAGRASGGKSNRPAEVCHRLVVEERGDRGVAEIVRAQALRTAAVLT